MKAILLCITACVAVCSMSANQENTPGRYFMGSESCRGCHLKEFDGWKQTRMANVLRNPHEHPEAILGDFAHPDPVRSFSLDDVAFVYGSRYKQRYFAKRGDDYFPLPAQWDVAKKRWLRNRTRHLWPRVLASYRMPQMSLSEQY